MTHAHRRILIIALFQVSALLNKLVVVVMVVVMVVMGAVSDALLYVSGECKLVPSGWRCRYTVLPLRTPV